MLVKELKLLAREVSNEIPNINYGGCAVFAGLVGKRLSKYYDIKIIVYSNNGDGKDLDIVKSLIKKNITREWNRNGIDFGHLVIEYTDRKGKTRQYDSCGTYPADGSICLTQDRVAGFLSVDECIELAADTKGWNNQFSRKYISKMEKLINDFFDNKELG
jgi:hypothetical protein